MNTAAIHHDNDWIGQVVDAKFTLLRWLGNSGQGDVFLTELDGQPSQRAAIKLIRANAPHSESQMAGWSAVQRLSHPHLMRLFHVGSCQINGNPQLYAVMEYAEENLSQVLPDRALTPAETKEMLDPLLDALSYVHGKGLVHGHLKPSNIMAVNDQLKLSCDGIQAAGPTPRNPSPFTAYDAPERAAQKTSPAADVWSLGISLVEALAQHPPVWDKSKQKEPVVPESIPQPFAQIAKECLRTDPALRCTLAEVKARLNPVSPIASASKGSAAAEKTVPRVASRSNEAVPAEKAPAKSRMPAIIGAVLVLLAIIVFLTMRSRQTSPSTQQQSVPAAEAPSTQSPAPESPASSGTVNGAVASQVLPDVSETARNTIHGTVKVKVRAEVDPSGSVSNATLESTGPSRYFSGLALEAARQWKFKPAQMNGKSVSSVWMLQFAFRQTGTTVTPVETSPKL